MFEGDSADMCAGKFPLMLRGGRTEGLACTDPGARTPIGVSGNFFFSQGDPGLGGEHLCLNQDNKILLIDSGKQRFEICIDKVFTGNKTRLRAQLYVQRS